MALLFTSYADSPCFNSIAEERLLSQLLRGAAAKEQEPFRALGTGGHPVDLLVSKEAYELRADALGLSADDVAVEVHEGILVITAGTSKPAEPVPAPSKKGTSGRPPTPVEPSAVPPQLQWQLLRRERTAAPQRWSRAFVLPDTADVDGIAVSLEHGVLTVRVPVRPPLPKPQPRRFAVNSSAAAKAGSAAPSQLQQKPAADVQRPSSPPAAEARQPTSPPAEAGNAGTGAHAGQA